MADRAHIRYGAVIQYYNGERGRIKLENGGGASPVVIGFVAGNDKVVMVENLTIDNSTTDHTVSETVEDVQVDKVVRTTTTRDMTQEEIDAAETITAAQQWQILQDDPNLWVQLDYLFDQQNAINAINGDPAVNKPDYNADYRAALRQRINQMANSGGSR